MQIKNTESRFGSVAMLFHWLMAVLIIGLLGLGLYMMDLPLGVQKLRFYGWHKEFGILVLMLVIARFAWRVSNINPVLPAHMKAWEKFAAHSAHYAFYGFMVAMPITGWMMSSASGLPVSFFGLFILPDLVGQSETLRKLLAEIHEWLGYGLIATLCAHVGASLQHHFINKDDILRRMLP
jgi:cytochrome b561